MLYQFCILIFNQLSLIMYCYLFYFILLSASQQFNIPIFFNFYLHAQCTYAQVIEIPFICKCIIPFSFSLVVSTLLFARLSLKALHFFGTSLRHSLQATTFKTIRMMNMNVFCFYIRSYFIAFRFLSLGHLILRYITLQLKSITVYG